MKIWGKRGANLRSYYLLVGYLTIINLDNEIRTTSEVADRINETLFRYNHF